MAKKLRKHNDAELAASARKKIEAGETKLSRLEREALNRVERQEEEELRWAVYKDIPQRDYRQMSGKSASILREHQTVFGLPFGERSVDLTVLLPAIHQFLSDNRRVLRKVGEPETVEETPHLDRLRKAQAEKQEIEVAKQRRELIPAEQVQTVFGMIANVLRGASDELKKVGGMPCKRIMIGAVEEAEELLEKMFAIENTNGQA